MLAARDSRDMQWVPQWGQRRDNPGVEGNHGERPTCRSANNSARMEKLGGWKNSFDLTASGQSSPPPGKSRQSTKLTMGP